MNLLILFALQVAADPVEAARSLLPAGERRVDAMTYVWPDAYYALAGQVERAMAERPEWLLELVRKSQPGKPLPYDPRFGLSEEEYALFLKLSAQISLKKLAEESARVKEEDGLLRIVPGPRLMPEIGELILDPKSRVIRTRYGDCAYASAVNTPADHAFPWDGHRWKGGGPGKTLMVSLGRFRRTGQPVAFVRYGGIHEGREIPPLELVLAWEAPEGKAAATSPAPEPVDESLSNDEVDRLFIQAQIKVAREHIRAGGKAKAVLVLKDVIKDYPKHVETKEAKKLLDELSK